MIVAFPEFFEEDVFIFPSRAPLIAQGGTCLLPEELLAVPLHKNLHRKMVESWTAPQPLVAIGHLRAKQAPGGGQELYSVLGLGRVLSVNLSAQEGHLLVLGLCRVGVKNLLADAVYPALEIERLKDFYSETAPVLLEALGQELVRVAQKLRDRQKNFQHFKNEAMPPDYLENLQREELPLGRLCDGIGAFFLFSAAEKQSLLAELNAIERAKKLLFILQFHAQSLYHGQSPIPLV